jgi:hypothetical protein
MTTEKSAKAAANSEMHVPKPAPQPVETAGTSVSEGVSGDDLMTSAQASSLKTLSEQAREPEAYDPELTKAEASRRIDALRAKLQLASDPPHTA